MEYATSWRLERHLKEQYSGFSFKCTVCKSCLTEEIDNTITNVDMLLCSTDVRKGEEAVMGYERYDNEIMPAHMISEKRK